MRKYLLLICFLSVSFLPLPIKAFENLEEHGEISFDQETVDSSADSQVFRAKVLRVLEERDLTRPSGEAVRQQNLELIALDGEDEGEIIKYFGLSDIDVIVGNIYYPGDRVYVMKLVNDRGEDSYYVTDFIRSQSLWLLAIVFIAALLFIGGRKGLRAVFSLFLSLLVILKFFVPLVLEGWSPLVVALPTTFLILLIIVYLTEGWQKKSHIAVLSIALSLMATLGLAALFTYLTRLTGAGQGEEVAYLVELSGQAIDFRGLLLAAIIIGALGVLNDMAVGQVESVQQIKLANPKLNFKQVYQSALKIGRSHLGAIANTLFLAYVGAALPLILLFSLGQEPFTSFGQIINNEEVATEIVRTLVGVIGLSLVMPISSFLASFFLKTPRSLSESNERSNN